MQPYFFPYIGYFQLMNAVDKFVVYDNLQYTKQSWINRNRILANGKDDYVSVPLKKGPHYRTIKERFLSDSWPSDRTNVLNKISGNYRRAPYFQDVYPVIEQCLICEEQNLFDFVLHSLMSVKNFLGIDTPIIISSTIDIDHGLKGGQKVLEICKSLGATTYLNPIGGVELYDKDQFKKAGIQLDFLRTGNVQYTQFNNEFVPLLSIIDVMMFNDKEAIGRFLTQEFTIE